jgi:hypothetical protein
MENIAEKVKEKLKGAKEKVASTTEEGASTTKEKMTDAKEEVKVLLRNVLAVVVLLPKKTEHLKRVAQ